MTSSGKQKIAVLGGGVGALSAAFYLTEQPGWSEKYEITVYQQGWRLGGKCASGHDLRPGYGWRIYEHGLHIFAGFYDQAFDLLRRAYDEIDRPDDHPNKTVWDAFTPEDNIALVDNVDPEQPNRLWYMNFEPNGRLPGDSLDAAPMIVMIQRLVAVLVHGTPVPLQKKGAAGQTVAQTPAPGPVEDPFAWLWHFVQKTADELESLAMEFILHQLILVIEQKMKSVVSGPQDPTTTLEIERFLLSAYLVQSVVRGVIAFDLLNKGYDSIDTYEWSEWLYLNAVEVAKGSPEWGDPVTRANQLLDWAPIATLYDYVFGFGDGGDVKFRSFGAGTALRSAMLMISYKGHFFWKMRGAMGDVVIAPVYLALKQRGVRFNFFTRITGLNIDANEQRLASIDYVQQVGLKDPDAGYQPLVDIPIPGWPRPLEGWPATPLWDQLADADADRAAARDFEAEHNDAPGAGDVAGQLKAGVDFDLAVLGISVGGLKQVCASFPERLPQSKWGPMFGAITLTRTVAMQLWLTRRQDDLGNQGPDRTLTGAGQPYSSWSDMSHLLARETWNGADRPRSIAYFCGQMQGPENGLGADIKAYDLAVSWLSSNSALYWSRATGAGSPYGLDPGLLFDPEPALGGDPLTRQYIRANCNPSDLYVQSPKNSVYTRMDANESGLDNLFLTGDWTLNGLNSGCAEAAARSGARCADAIGGTLTPLPL